MRFSINSKLVTGFGKLSYVSKEYSFVFQPECKRYDHVVLFNDIELIIANEAVKEVHGLCPHTGWIPTDSFPLEGCAHGALLVEIDKQHTPGVAYRYNEKELSTYVNRKRKWVCIGDPLQKGECVEFLPGCTAIVSEGRLAALWLRPDTLPAPDSTNLRMIDRKGPC